MFYSYHIVYLFVCYFFYQLRALIACIKVLNVVKKCFAEAMQKSLFVALQAAQTIQEMEKRMSDEKRHLREVHKMEVETMQGRNLELAEAGHRPQTAAVVLCSG